MVFSNNIGNSFGVTANCKELIEVNTLDELHRLKVRGVTNDNYFIVGGGNNILPQSYFEGVVIKPTFDFIDVVSSDNESVEIKVGSGVEWDYFVNYCVKSNLSGLENLSLIPGTVGAAPVHNIGAYGREVSSFITSVECYDLKKGELFTLSNIDCDFEYRDSAFKRLSHLLIVAVSFKLYKSNKKLTVAVQNKSTNKFIEICSLLFLCISSISIRFSPFKISIGFSNIRNILLLSILAPNIKRKLVCFIRKKTLHNPSVIGNAGCFFKCPTMSKNQFVDFSLKNPSIEWFEHDSTSIKLSVCSLLRSSGWAGHQKGHAKFDQKRPVVLLNLGAASGEDLLEVVLSAQEDVFNKFGVLIEPEVVIM